MRTAKKDDLRSSFSFVQRVDDRLATGRTGDGWRAYHVGRFILSGSTQIRIGDNLMDFWLDIGLQNYYIDDCSSVALRVIETNAFVSG